MRAIESPMGILRLVGSDGVVTRLLLEDQIRGFHDSEWVEDDSAFPEASSQLLGYFDGRLKVFDAPRRLDGTAFQRRVWAAIEAIPYGATRTYGELAGIVGAKGAARAVGQAAARNPVPVIVPCHRVLASRGALGGYAGGLGMKQALLALERT